MGRAATPWLRNGLIAGTGAGIATLVLGLAWAAAKSDYCQAGTGAPAGRPLSASDIVGTLSGVAVLLLAAGIAGWQSARVGPGNGRPALTGLVTGLVSGIGTLVLNVIQLDQNTQCMVRVALQAQGWTCVPSF